VRGFPNEERKQMETPEIVSDQEWERAHEELLAKEKEMMKAEDELAAERRRAPMREVSTDFSFEGPDGPAGFLDLFDGRSQLVVYHFWFPEDGNPCTGCSMVADQMTHVAHMNARDLSVAFVSRARQERIAAYKERMGWEFPWYTDTLEFQEAYDTTEYFAFDVFLRDGDRAFQTYRTRSRGVEGIGPVWSFLDRTPFGRQEEWEDTPPGRPQSAKYSWWAKHDEY
jgi:predicted dithiol-disulfide oxidoreductase (DUF899 family)